MAFRVGLVAVEVHFCWQAWDRFQKLSILFRSRGCRGAFLLAGVFFFRTEHFVLVSWLSKCIFGGRRGSFFSKLIISCRFGSLFCPFLGQPGWGVTGVRGVPEPPPKKLIMWLWVTAGGSPQGLQTHHILNQRRTTK